MASRTRMLIAGVLIAGLAGLSVVGIPTAAGAKSAKLQVGPGVTKDSITLGVLTDQTGPFAAASAGIAQGRQLYWIAKNAQGGVCDRTVKFSIQDHAYNAQNATSLYAQQQPNVLAFDELLGLADDRGAAAEHPDRSGAHHGRVVLVEPARQPLRGGDGRHVRHRDDQRGPVARRLREGEGGRHHRSHLSRR